MTTFTHWALLSAAGCIESHGVSKKPPEGSIQVPGELTEQEAPRWFFNGEGWEPRPGLTPPAAAGGILDLSGLPLGTSIQVLDEETRAVFGTLQVQPETQVLELPDAGTYLLEIMPPQPWWGPVFFPIEISEAQL